MTGNSKPFNQKFYPSINGVQIPPELKGELHDDPRQDLANTCYYLNMRFNEITALRSEGSSETPVLQAIEKLLIRREKIEKRLHSIGIDYKIIVQDGFAVDIQLDETESSDSSSTKIDSGMLKVRLPPQTWED